MALEAARIKSLPDTGYYIPEFITEEEEERLLQKITSAPAPRWTQLTHRRLQTWPATLTKSNTLLTPTPLPPWLTNPIITPRLDNLSIFSNSPHKAPNHVLINEYRPGQGIMPHEDGAAYFPVVATVSLGAGVVFDVFEKRAEEDEEGGEEGGRLLPRYRILQERRSLLITTDKLYTDYLHGIAERERDEELGAETICNWELLGDKEGFACGSYKRETRISLTYRDVLKVSKLGNSMKFLGSK